MNLFLKKYTLKMATTFVCLVIFASCSSKNDPVTPAVDGTVLNVTVKGIEEVILIKDSDASTSNLRASSNNRISGESSTTTNGTSLVSLGDVDAFIDVKENAGTSNLVQSAIGTNTTISTTANNKSIASSNSPLRAANVLMGTGVQYRLLIYNSSNVLIVNKLAISGTNPLIKIDAGKNYTWYAVSINESTGTMPDINSSGIIAKSSLTNKDVLYASGSISTVYGENYLNIIFRRNTAKIQVELNVRGTFGTIDNATSISVVKNSTNTNVIQIGDLDIKTGNYSSLVDVNPILGSSMVAVAGNPSNTVKTATFYTVNPAAITANNFKIKLNELKIAIEDARVRSFASNKIYTYPAAYTPTQGSSYVITMRVIDSPVKVKGIYWARTNLRYNAAHMDQYRLKPNPGGSTSAEVNTEFWNWKSTTPTGATGSFDPCAAAYPAGTWRMPTAAEWQLLAQPNEKRSEAGFFFGVQYAYVWTRDSDNPINSAYDDPDLFVALGGYRTTSGTVTGSPAGIGLGGLAAGTFSYWSGTGINATTATEARASFAIVFFVPVWTNVTYPSAPKAEGKNIRCVRQITNSTGV
ncbi:hypothetical protein LZQ00_17145 [Sphingobacterium sp. SRCM116780]|uniref:hypothetical protein n=1 Tax=Sphingobacterium sp. SRCM116780 TaxID=2907623 RepID=UPI001F18F472|nr:hypothetical protein [Sphingobacterium sp. SRCM116780]UIR55976.1 hypothetical protein LZQ00_17145 [Sphingobacterium sp. SRCM116780]